MIVTYRSLGSFGRLGNQLFQIAATIGIAQHNGFEFAFPPWSFNRFFARPLPVLSNPGQRLAEHREDSFTYRPIKLLRPTNLLGYFQSERYFSHCSELVRSHFAFDTTFINQCLSLYGDGLDEKSCSLHVRRGDYVNHPCFVDLQATDYYEAAMESLPKRTRFLVFSDDIQFCRDRFQGEQFSFIATTSPIADLLLMSHCASHIIANSSFSWWGAWLNPHPTKHVIAPSRWFKGNAADPCIEFVPGPPHSGYHDTADVVPKQWVLR